jgi:uncharacterized membrane protein HdeD (DUF308 family)
MKNRMSLSRSMVLTGVIAVNLGLISAANRVPDLFVLVYICGPILLLVQLGILLAVVGLPERRAFRFGFAATGSGCAILLMCAIFHTETQSLILDSYSGFWKVLEQLAPTFERFVSSSEFRRDFAVGAFFFVPQLLLAAIGGAVDDGAVASVRRRRPADPSTPQ